MFLFIEGTYFQLNFIFIKCYPWLEDPAAEKWALLAVIYYWLNPAAVKWLFKSNLNVKSHLLTIVP